MDKFDLAKLCKISFKIQKAEIVNTSKLVHSVIIKNITE